MQWSATAAYAAEAQRKRVIRPPVVEEERTDESAAAALPESVRAERALVKKPRDRQARLQAAKARLADGADNASNVEAARNHATQVLADNPNDLEALLLAGQTSILKNDLTAAAPPSAVAGDPVSLYNGAQELPVTDIVVQGVFPIVIQRKYDSQSSYDSTLGYGWAFMQTAGCMNIRITPSSFVMAVEPVIAT